MPSGQSNKKILAINFFPAFTPPKSGGELRYYHIYRFLRNYYDITMVNPTHLFVEPEEIQRFPNMREFRIPKNKHHLFLHRFFSRVGRFRECSAVVVMLASSRDKMLRNTIEKHLLEADIVIHESPFLFHLTPRRENQIFIYNSYNVEYKLHREMLNGALGAVISRKVRSAEKRACRMSDLVFASSEQDRLDFSHLYDISLRKIITVPNGVDPEEITPASREERDQARKELGLKEKPALIFFGSAHPPNREAAEFILDRLAPAFPQACFLIAGKVCEALAERHLPNVTMLGVFTDEEKHRILKAADVALNPMFAGSGSNLKMFDYLSAGLPVIATPTGARGVPLINYTEAIITEAEGFPRCIETLLSRPDLRQILSRRGRSVIEEKYHWKHAADKIHAAIEDLHKPHVTVVNDFPLVPPRHGGQYRILNLYRNLSRYIPVNYLCLHKESDEIEETPLEERFLQTAIPKGLFWRMSESVLNRLLGYTIDDILGIFFAHRNRILKREVAQASAFNDILIVVHPYQWKVLRRYRSKNICIYESLNYETALKRETLPGIIARFLVMFVKGIEKRAIGESRATLTVSDEEAEAFTRDFGLNAKCITIPNGADASKIQPASPQEKEALKRLLELGEHKVALFIGSAHPPNVEAGRYLVEKIAPQTPDVLFFILGSVCWILKNIPGKPSNVKLFFEVEEDVRNALFKVADIAVNPMTKGAGTSLKMFDCLAAGLPVISTPIGARGVARKGVQPVILSELNQFSSTIREIFAQPEKRIFHELQGWNFVREYFDWGVIAKKLYEELSTLLKGVSYEKTLKK
ncbi:glycosyltransferase family 4 protein [Candidatus Sumerlaeota bacterium]|nr:glycosyltransferase family 4 protein [Candidatus Sumerlaeota bacterium]